MQPNLQATSTNGHPPPPGLKADDILFTLFRHKRLILACFLAGVVGAGLVRAFYPPIFFSEAKLNVPYVATKISTGPIDPDSSIQLTDSGGQMILGTEIETLKSFDIASNAAFIVTPERILGKKGGGSNILAAAKVISAAIEVSPSPRSSTLQIYFFHRDPTVVQPVLNAFIEAYKIKHFNLHRKSQFDDEYFQRRVEEMRKQIAKSETELGKLLQNAKMLSVEDTKKAYQDRILKLQEDLATAKRDLAETKAVLGETAQPTSAPQTNDGLMTTPPPETIEEYNSIITNIRSLRQKAQDLTSNGYKEAHPMMLTIRGQLDEWYRQRSALTNQYPQLVNIAVSTTGTNALGAGIMADIAGIKRLTTRVGWLADELTNLQAQASHIIEIEPVVASLSAQLALDRTNYQSYVRSLELARISTSLDAGKQVSIGMVEEPTPPLKNTRKIKKLLGAVFGGCCGLGLGLAFLIDFVLDRSIKRSVEIERRLHLRVLQCIPDTTWSDRPRLPWSDPEPEGDASALAGAGQNGHDQSSLAVWDPVHHLHPYTEGLRERLMTYFEGNDLSLKKPKLVGVTACERGSGVTTLASGLAASLSRVGSGNVLFVDMNSDEGAAHPFYQGKAGCGLTDVLETQHRADAKVEEQLYVACLPKSDSARPMKPESLGLAHLMPQITASDYDYVIFDLPPVSQTNSTARLAGYMDLTLLVVEAEKTGQQAAMRANALMNDARATVAAVLNKYRKHVPERFSQEL